MNKLYKADVARIVHNLHRAERFAREIAAHDNQFVREATLIQHQLTIDSIRGDLLAAALTDVEVEPIAGSAPCDSLHTRASLDKVGEVADPAPDARGKYVPTMPASQSQGDGR